jgi:acetyltransferase-like isoleucine patch superfamily enzyme
MKMDSSITSKIKANPILKRLALRMLIPINQYKPRLWVRLILNPFKHKKGKGSIIQRRTRMDLFPYHKFELGDGSIIEDFTTVNNGVGDVLIGNKTIIGIGNTLIGPIAIGNDVMLAQNIVISALNHGYQDVSISPSRQKVICKPIIISDRVWIGANCVITAGVKLGKHSIVGAGSVVTKDIPDYSVAVGNPAKVVKQYNSQTGLWEKL